MTEEQVLKIAEDAFNYAIGCNIKCISDVNFDMFWEAYSTGVI